MKVSIITASYNSEATIFDTLDSVNTQSYDDWEHIIVDGGSTDSTIDIVSAQADSKRVYSSEADDGLYYAMNKGIRLASGEVVCFLNSDDFYSHDAVLAVVTQRFLDPEVDIVYGNLEYVKKNDPKSVVRRWSTGYFVKGAFLTGWTPPHPAVFVRRRVFDQVGLFDTSFRICADWDWLYRAFEVCACNSVYIDDYLIKMRTGGVSNGSWRNLISNNTEIARSYKKHGRSMPFSYLPRKNILRLKQYFTRR